MRLRMPASASSEPHRPERVLGDDFSPLRAIAHIDLSDTRDTVIATNAIFCVHVY